jgi:hypothetical protein
MPSKFMQEKIRYIGPNKINGVVILEEKTPNGKELVKVLYENNVIPAEVMPMVTFENLVSDAPKDWNWIRDQRYAPLLKDIASLCLEYDVIHSDINALAEAIKNKLEAAFARATNYLWTKDDAQFIPGMPALSFRSLLEADAILKGIKKDEPKDEQPKSE